MNAPVYTVIWSGTRERAGLCPSLLGDRPQHPGGSLRGVLGHGKRDGVLMTNDAKRTRQKAGYERTKYRQAQKAKTQANRREHTR